MVHISQCPVSHIPYWPTIYSNETDNTHIHPWLQSINQNANLSGGIAFKFSKRQHWLLHGYKTESPGWQKTRFPFFFTKRRHDSIFQLLTIGSPTNSSDYRGLTSTKRRFFRPKGTGSNGSTIVNNCVSTGSPGSNIFIEPLIELVDSAMCEFRNSNPALSKIS